MIAFEALDPPDDPRPSDPRDVERPSSVAIIARCVLCGQDPQHRRTCCRRCYRKFRAAMLPLPDPHPPGPPPGTGQGDPVQQWAAALTDRQRMKLLRALLGPELLAVRPTEPTR